MKHFYILSNLSQKLFFKRIQILVIGIFLSQAVYAVAPDARTVSANRVTYTSAILNALVNANSLSTTISFEYGLTTAYGSSITVPGTLLGAADSFRKVNLTNLMAHKVYHFRVVATNASGTTNGGDMTFITGGVSSSNNGKGNHTLIVDSAGIVYAFGINNYGQLGDGTTVQKTKPIRVLKGAYSGTAYLGDNPSNPIIAVASGSSHSLALAADGTVWAWGNNSEGQLGDGTGLNRLTPVKVVKGLYVGTSFLGDNAINPIISISAGLMLSSALSADGKIYTFGFNINGQLGNNSTVSSFTPIISLKGAYNGTTYLGDNITNPIIAMNCGSSHIMALAADGQVFTYGFNSTGQLGDGSVSSKGTPVKPFKGVYLGTTNLGDDPANPIIAISTHGYSSFALSKQGGLYSFGYNNGGQLGDGTVANKLTPIRVLKGAYSGTTYLGDNPANPIQSFCGGPHHTLVLTSDGALYSFGTNLSGQLGDGTIISRNTPVRVLKGAYSGTTYLGDNPTNPIVAIMASDSFGLSALLAYSMVITADGHLYSFGYNSNGQLGDNSNINRSTPVRVQHVGAAGYLNVLESTRPSAKTVIANRITYTSANLNGIVNANTFTTTVSFEYGLTNAYGSTKSVPGSISGTNDQFIKVNLSGLLPHQMYYYRIKAVNAKGTSYGTEMTFITGGSSHSNTPSGSTHNIILDSNGIVYTMGENIIGQLGDNTNIKRILPVRVLKGAYSGTKYLGDNPANPIVAVSEGTYHSLALAADGTVYSFGYNTNGQLGDGTTTNRFLPVRVLKGTQYTGTSFLGDNPSNPMIAVSGGRNFSFALAANGTIYSFGGNLYGELGDSSGINQLTPVRVKKGEYIGTNFIGDNPSNPVVSISSGNYSSLILTADGSVYGLAYNGFGQLGDSTTSSALTPVRSLKGLYNGNQFLGDNLVNPIVKVISTYYHSLCLAYDGTLYSMGYNSFGQLGNGTTTNSLTPVKVIKGAYFGTTYLGDNPINPVISIFGGDYSSFALMKNGTLFSFGYNAYGQLGDGTNTNRISPVAVLKGDYNGISNLGDSASNPIVSILGASYVSTAIAKDGNLYSFGYNGYGQIGDNSIINKNVPTQMRGVGMHGYLNVLQNSLAPTAKTVPANRITFTSASLNALVNPNTVSTTVSFEYGLTNAYGSIATVSGTFTGGDDTFLRANITNLIPHRTYYYRVKTVNSYGTNYGQEMTFIPGSNSSNTNSSSIQYFNIILDSNGIVYTTGSNATGQLGDGTTIDKKVPIRVLKGAYSGTKYLGDNPSNPIISVASGGSHALALAADGTIYSFGFNGFGQLGDGTNFNRSLPVRVLKGAQYTGTSFLGDNPANRIIAISCGNYFSLALSASGIVYAFGYNSNGELGDSTFISKSLPIRTKRGMYNGTSLLGDNPNNPIISISSGDYNSLAIAADGMVYGFGYNAYGQLGDNSTVNRNTPVLAWKGNYNGITYLGDDVANPIVKAKLSGLHSLCLASDGTIYSMGYNGYGQLGDGTSTDRLTPVRALKGAYAGTTYLGDNVNNPIKDIKAGIYTSTGLTQNGNLFSWGYNGYGGIGDGTTTNRLLPVAVLKGAYGGTTYLGDSVNNPIVYMTNGTYSQTAITQNGYIFSFGFNILGQLGDNTFNNRVLPVQMRGVGMHGYLNVLQNSLAPTAKTVPANRITFTSASLNALVNPNTVSTTVSFEYGLTNAYGSIATVSGTFTGGDDTFLRANITNLIPHRTYYYRVKTVNSYGTNYGQEMTFIPGSNSSNTNVSASKYFNIILDSNGIVYTIGSNITGQLGDGTLIDKKVPIRVLKGAYAGTKYLGDNPANPIIAVAAGSYHALALDANGTIYSFGYNAYGQLGDGTNNTRLLPVRVFKGAQYVGTTFLGDNPANKIIAISCGAYSSAALSASGVLYTFGFNGSGELGDSTFISRTLPVRTKRGLYSGTSFLGDDMNNPIISISSGDGHSLALAADGMVYGFGYNAYGQLGDNTSINRSAPVLALMGNYNGTTYLGDDISNPIVKAKASGLHNLYLASDGTVYSIGYNTYGQLGDGTTINRMTPVRALMGAYAGTTYLGDDVNNPIRDINAGSQNSAVLTQDGKLFSWGYNGYGGLGDGTFTNRVLPVAVLKGAYGGTTYLGDSVNNPIVSISSGLYNQTAITQNGYIFSFGYNSNGQFGNNTLTNQSLPSQMRGVGLNGNLNVLQNSLAPEVHTIPANQITFTGAALNCLVNANTVSTAVSFEYGLTNAYGSVVNIPGNLTGGEDSFRTALITGLTPHRTYHYRVKAVNAYGTIYGEDMSYITGGASSNYSSNGEHSLILDSSGIVYASGLNVYGQLGDGTAINRTIPIKVLKGAYAGTTYLGDNPANPIVAVATGFQHSIALAKDGSVYTFGYNLYGQLGNGTTTNSATPVKVLTISNTQAIAASLYSSYVLLKDGSVYSFGYNGYGNLGDSTTTNRTTPVRMKKGIYPGTSFIGDDINNPILKISTGGYHFIAMAADGKVYTVGHNAYGQLGDNTTSDRYVPVKMAKGQYIGNADLGDDVSNPIIAIAGGIFSTLALDANGLVYGNGYNGVGQLGDGTFFNRVSPVKVLEGSYNGTTYLGDNASNPIVSIASGSYHGLALDANGLAYTFGYNFYGQLGDSTLTNRLLPISVNQGQYSGSIYLGGKSSNPIVSISGGANQTFAISADGYVLGFGKNDFGQIGNGTIVSRTTPVLFKGVGNIGYLNVLRNEQAPVVRTVPATKVTYTSATLNGLVRANILNTTVSFEYGLTTSYGNVIGVPGFITGNEDSFKRATISGLIPHKIYHYRVRAINAKDTTFGKDMIFVTGSKSSSNTSVASHQIFVDSAGIVYTVGYNLDGQLGDGTTTQNQVPIKVLKGAYAGTTYLGDNPANPIIAVAAGVSSSIALAADGTVYTFGLNAQGQLGDGTTLSKSLPVKVLKGAYTGTTFLGDNVNNPIISITSGANHCMALALDGTAYAFGYNIHGQLGDGTTIQRLTPIRVFKGAYNGNVFLGDDLNNPIVSISSNTYHSLALTAKGEVFTFGYNLYGQLGDSTTLNKLVPVKPLKGDYLGNQYLGDSSTNPIAYINAGGYHSTVIDENGKVYSFGLNHIGQLGNGSLVNKLVPTEVSKGVYAGSTQLGDNPVDPIIALSAGVYHTLALSLKGEVYAFGYNVFGQIGDNTFTNRSTPVKVLKGAYSGTSYIGDYPSNRVVSLSTGEYSSSMITEDGYVFSYGRNTRGQTGDNSLIQKNAPVLTHGVNDSLYLNVLRNIELPLARTVPATRVTFKSANLNAVLNANMYTATASFEYGLTTSYGSVVNIPGSITGNMDVFKKVTVSALTPHTTYHYRVRIINILDTIYGEDMTFITGNASNSFSYGGNHTVVLDSSGIVYGYGDNANYQLGDATIINRKVPVKVLKGAYNGTTYLGDNPLNPIIAVAEGTRHTLALAADGTLYSFGWNDYGQLGDGSLLFKTTPVKVLKGSYAGTTYLGDNPANPIIGIEAGTESSAAIALDGTVFTFGNNTNGQLGDSTVTSRSLPVKVVRGLYDGTAYLGDNPSNPIISISIGSYTSAALAADGTAYTFGSNAGGQLGIGNTTSKISPVRAIKGVYSGTLYLGDNPTNPIVSIKCGTLHTIALTRNGSVYTFGNNSNGQLGDGAFATKTSPIRPIKGMYGGTTFLGDNLANPIVSISCGLTYSQALAADGTIYSFGNNAYGQLGDNTNVNRNSPIRMLKGLYTGASYIGDASNNPIVAIACGEVSSIAIAKNGYVYSIGTNFLGTLGDGSNTTSYLPVMTLGVSSNGFLNVLNNRKAPNARTVPASRITFTSAILNALVNANIESTQVSFEYGLSNSYGSIVHVPGLLTGDADSFRKAMITGLLPHKTYHYRVRAINVKDTTYGVDMTFITGGTSSKYAGSADHVIVVDSQGIVYAVGKNDNGQLGDALLHPATPTRVAKGAYNGTAYLGDNPNNPIIAVSSGGFHSLALAADGTVYAFGSNSSGQLGDGTFVGKTSAIRVLKGAYSGTTYLGDNPNNPIIAIHCSGYSSIAIDASGKVYSFGYNNDGELGDNTIINRNLPVFAVKGAYNGTSYLGDNPANPIIAIGGNVYHSIALSADGAVFAFGYNGFGQLGDSSTVTRTAPVRMLKGLYAGNQYLGDDPNNPIIGVAVSFYNTLALALDGTIYGCGRNSNGELGDTTFLQRLTPVRAHKGASYSGTTYLGDNPSNPIVSIVMGQTHSLALANDGSVYGFGLSDKGQLGNGSLSTRNKPFIALKGAYPGTTNFGDVPGNKVVSISGGRLHSMAITTDGIVYGFGDNGFGQLGDNTTTLRTTPVQTSGVNNVGKLNVLANTLIPKAVTVPATRITYTSAILNAIVNSNTRYTTVEFEYGLTNTYGNTVLVATSFMSAEDSFKKWTLTGLIPHRTYHYRVKASSIAGISYGKDLTFTTGSKSSSPAMSYSSLILDSNGIVYAFGNNSNGQLGDSTLTDRNLPVRVLKGAYNGTTYLGDNPANPIVAVSMGQYHALALDAAGVVYAFGANSNGELGDSTTIQKTIPVKVKKGLYSGTAFLGDNPLNPIISIQAGNVSSMALAADGTLYSFGNNSQGQLGDSSSINRITPVRVKKGAYAGANFLGDHPSNPIIAFSNTGMSCLALAANGTVYAFGDNFYGQLGDGSGSDRTMPVRTLKGTYPGTTFMGDNVNNPILSISMGIGHSLVLSSEGRVYSFGRNTDGALGNGNLISSNLSVNVVKGVYAGNTYLGDDTLNPVVSIAAGYYHSMAMTRDGSIFSFGMNASNGQLGDGTLLNRNAPVSVIKGAYVGNSKLGDQVNNPIVSIMGGWFHSMAIAQDGFVYAWGQNNDGELGDNTIVNKSFAAQTRGVNNTGYLNVLNSSLKPSLTAVPATRITYTSANLNSLFNPNSSTTSVRFEYGLTTAYGDTISIPGTFSGSVNEFRKASISGLTPHRTYHYRTVATNVYGTTYSDDRTFVTGSSSSLYSSSGNHTLILDSSGIVYAFGDNAYGQLGDSTIANRIIPIRVKKGAYNGTTYLGDNPANPIIAVSAGENHSMALAADGTVYSFGLNTYGQLGHGTTLNKIVPTKVVKGAYTGTTYLGDNVTNPIIAISSGASHSLALASDGTVFSFGYNSSGELGDNTITQRTIPTKVLKGAYIGSSYLGDNSNPMISIAASRYHSAALGADGTVYTFGRNAEGQLGDASLTNRLTPVRTVKGEYIGSTYLGDYYKNAITAIAANDYRTMVLAADGTVYSFGYNGNGQLGDSTTTNRNTPVHVLKGEYTGGNYLGEAGNKPITSISLGTFHSSALVSNGRAFNFGANFFGQLGNGTTTQSIDPVRVLKGTYVGNIFLGSDSLNPIVSISSGNNHSIAIDQDGYVYAYGYNNQGQLGDSTLVNRTTPISVRSASGVGRLNVFFNELIPSIKTIPANRVTYTTAYLSALVNTQNVPTTISFEYGLSTSYTNTVQLSGSFSSNQMQRVSQYLCNLIPGKTYHYRTVAINAEGTVYGPDQTFVTGSASNIYSGNGSHNLLVGSDGIVYSYGYNDFGQLGDSVGAFRTKPIKVYRGAYNGTKYLGDNPNNPIISVARGGYSSIALAADGTVYSFGENSTGSLGDNTTIDKMIPVRVLKGAYNGTTYLGDNPSNPIISISMGFACTYALALDGTVYSFGWNNGGRLGDSTTTNRSVPIRVKKGAYAGTNYLGDHPSNPIVSISNGFSSFYAIDADGLVYAMGSNNVGQLGIGNSIDKWVPVKVLKGAYSGTTYLGDDANNPIVSVSGGSSFVLALSGNGTVYSFGLNSGGQLGDSTIAPANIPVRVKKGVYAGTTFLGDNPANPVIAISAGGAHSMALTADNSLYAFGSNTKGQLGDNTLVLKRTPVRVLKGAYAGTNFIGDNSNNPIISISLSNEYSTILTRDGNVYSTGDNFNGTLADNTLINKSTAVKAVDLSGAGTLDLIQCNSFSSIPTVLGTTYTSQHSDTDGTGWRHYCTVDNQLLLSLKIGSSGAVISDDSVRLKLATTTTMSSTLSGGMITNVNGYAIFERRWDVKPTTQPSSPVGLKYYFTPKEYSDLVVALANLPSPSTFTNVNQLTMYKATSGAPFADPHTVPGVLLKAGSVPNSTRWKYAPHGNCNHSAEYNVASFSGGGGGGGGGGDTTSALLPVELLSFKGQWSEDDAILTWVTASERNSDRFEVERSIDGINFTKVGTVKSKGNSTEVLTYMFNDVDAGQAKVDGYYYRLKQVDFDGAFEYAQIIYLRIEKKAVDAKVIVFPNPFVNELQVVMPTSSNSDVQIQISGVQGAMILNYMDKVDQDRRVKINTELLPAGAFILNVTQDGITSSHKIIKEL